MVIDIIDELLAPLWMTRWGRRMSWVVLGSALLLIAITFIQSCITLRSDYQLTALSMAPTHAISMDQTAQLIAQIPTWHLFGNGAALDAAALPVTSLQLRLVGVLKSSPEQFSRVIISESGQPGKVYEIGDALSDGVKINAITRDGVVLENAGRLEKLPLQRPALQFEGMPKSILDSQGE